MSPSDPNQDEDVRNLFSMLGKDRDAGRYRDFDAGLPPLPPRPAAAPSPSPSPAPARTVAPEPTAEPSVAMLPASREASAAPVAGMPAAPSRPRCDVAEPVRRWLDEAGSEAVPTASAAPAPGTASMPGASPERSLGERPLDEVFRRALGEQGDSDIGASLRRIGRS